MEGGGQLWELPSWPPVWLPHQVVPSPTTAPNKQGALMGSRLGSWLPHLPAELHTPFSEIGLMALTAML